MYRFRRISHDIMSLVPALVEAISQDEHVSALFLFGSYAEDRQGAASDVDLAVLLDDDLPRHLRSDKRLDLLALATTTLATDEVDLVVLNDAPASLAYRVFGQGRLLYERPGLREVRVRFQARTYSNYLDFLPAESIVHEGLMRRFEEGRFGG
ncbi:MAG: nucleotidyltransferase domain-containing protein [Bacillota bacterium]